MIAITMLVLGFACFFGAMLLHGRAERKRIERRLEALGRLRRHVGEEFRR